MSTTVPHLRLLPALLALALAWWVWPRGPAPETSAVESGSAQPPDFPVAVRPHSRGTTGALAGVVRGEDGAPFVGAHVCAWSLLPWADEGDSPRCTDSGSDGRYTLSGLLPLRYAVHASAPRHVPASAVVVALRPGERRADVDVSLGAGGVMLAGIVHDVSGGVVEGALLTTFHAADPVSFGSATTRSDAQGRFHMWVRPGQFKILARADGYAENVVYGPAPDRGLALVLTPASELLGSVVEAETRRPVVEARVTVVGDELAEPRTATTDDEGRFRLSGLPPGIYRPYAEADGRHGEAEHAIDLGLAETSAPVLIAARPVAAVSGRIIVRGSGVVCPSGRVTLTCSDCEGSRTLMEEVDGGLVTFPAVLPGSYEVRIVCAGFLAPRSLPPLRVQAAPIRDVVWEIARGQAMRGQVLDAGGRPVRGIAVAATPESETDGPSEMLGEWDEVTDAEGRFELAGLAEGAYSLSTFAEGVAGPAEPLVVSVSDRDREGVTLRLPPQGAIRGRVVDLRGDPAAGVIIEAQDDRGSARATEAASDGAFMLRGLLPGAYRIRAELRGRAPERESTDGVAVQVTADRVAETRLTVTRASGQIRGRVVDPEGHPLADAFVAAVLESGDAEGNTSTRLRSGGDRRRLLTDSDGLFVFDGLGAGQYSFRAHRSGGEVVVEHVEPGADITLTLGSPGSFGTSSELPARTAGMQ